jgi:hypothetical protein
VLPWLYSFILCFVMLNCSQINFHHIPPYTYDVPAPAPMVAIAEDEKIDQRAQQVAVAVTPTTLHMCFAHSLSHKKK